MSDFDDLKRQDGGPEDEADDLKISDLPAEASSYDPFQRLTQTREPLETTTWAFSRRAAHAQQTTSDADQQTNDETELEIHDLPPSTRGHYRLLALRARIQSWRAAIAPRQETPTLTRTQQHARTGRTLTALGLCVALLLLLVGNVPALRTPFIGLFEPATPTPTNVVYESSFAHGNVPIIIDRPNDPAMAATATAISGLAPLPASCPRASMLQSFLSPLDPPGLGDDPVWLVGFTGPIATLAFLQPSSQFPDTTYGWYQSLTVFIRNGFTGSVILHGASQNGMSDVEFSYVNLSYAPSGNGDAVNFAPDISLSLQNPGTVHFNANGDWEMTDINILVPQAGCYELQASWHNSTWTQYFAAGNVA